MSGVSRLRQARKNHPLPVMTTGGPQKGTAGRPTVNVDVGSGLAPKKSKMHMRYDIPVTKPPQSNERPYRGEGPTTNVRTER